MEKLKRNLGITLVALVVTIIILLILAGVAIGQLTNSGLFNNTKLAKEEYANAQAREDDILKQYENAIGGGEIASDRDDSAAIAELRQEIQRLKSQVGGVPAGTVISYIAGTDAPSGYLKCDGTVYNIADYKTLADSIKAGFGKYDYWGGDGTTTFAVPNLQGEFLRGTGTNANENEGSGADVGKHQDATILPNIWLWGDTSTNAYLVLTSKGLKQSNAVLNKDFTYIQETTGAYKDVTSNKLDSTRNETYAHTTRPTNTSVLYCIKF